MLKVLPRTRTICSTIRHLGLRWAAYRIGYALRRKTGILRRSCPASSWSQHPVSGLVKTQECLRDYRQYREENQSPFFFDISHRDEFSPYFKAIDENCVQAKESDTLANRSVTNVADDICNGWFRLFENHRLFLGEEIDWHCNPWTGQAAPSDSHWSKLDEFGSGDIKLVWEASRFSFVYPLVRAYWRTGDEKYSNHFWTLLHHWRRQNPPQLGVHWKCGQEISLRMLAWCFSLYGFWGSSESSSHSLTTLLQMIAVSAQRVSANINYAISQRNNHGISEAAGLLTAGLLFPELRESDHWLQVGQTYLVSQARELIYDDGAFSQHSANYHRVMLQLYTWCLLLSERHDRPLPHSVYERVKAAADFLWNIQDDVSGCVARYGQNDGGVVLSLTSCDMSDFRPAIQIATFVTTGRRRYAYGPHDEELLWLCGPVAQDAETSNTFRRNFAASDGGCHVLRSANGFAFLRCGNFHHRPSHADMLHCDVWWRGINVAIDPGTFSYSAPKPWNNPLAGTAYHNTVTIDGQDQMQRASRFLWLPWIRGKATIRIIDGSPLNTTCWEGEHDGYRRRGIDTEYRRGVLRIGREHWLVADRLRSSKHHRYRLHWLAPDFNHAVDTDQLHVKLSTPRGAYSFVMAATTKPATMSVVRGDPQTPRGWFAPYYFCRCPCVSISLEASADSMVFATVVGPGRPVVKMSSDSIEVTTTMGIARVEYSTETDSIFHRVEFNGNWLAAEQDSIEETIQAEALHVHSVDSLGIRVTE